MPDKARIEMLHKQVFADEGHHTYAVLDGASVDGLLPKLGQPNPPHVCLFTGELEPELAEAAPYLVELKSDDPFAAWVLAEGWGKHWGIFASSPADLRTLRGHCRSLVKVWDENGEPMYFRFYDPRVLPTFLPTCSTQQLASMFGPVSAYRCETTDPAVLLCLQIVAYLLYLVPPRVCPLDDIEFPFRRIKVGCAQDPLVYILFRHGKKGPEPVAKVSPQRTDDGAQLIVYPLVELPVPGGILPDPVKYLRLQIRQHDALEELEKPPLDHLHPVKGGVALLEFPEDVGNDHLVGLFIKLAQLHRPDLVVPPLHARGVMDFEEEAFADHHQIKAQPLKGVKVASSGEGRRVCRNTGREPGGSGGTGGVLQELPGACQVVFRVDAHALIVDEERLYPVTGLQGPKLLQ